MKDALAMIMKSVCIFCHKEFNCAYLITRIVCPICDCKYNKEKDGGSHVSCQLCYPIEA